MNMCKFAFVPFSSLKGKTLTSITVKEDHIDFVCDDGEKYRMLHYQDCCEAVYIEDIYGDIHALIGKPLLTAEEVSSDDDEPPEGTLKDDSYTWTFYKIGTMYHTVTIRWFGTSNGYYSESVDFIKFDDLNVEKNMANTQEGANIEVQVASSGQFDGLEKYVKTGDALGVLPPN